MKKSIILLIAMLLMAASAQSIQSFPMISGGGGTENSPYLISTPEELKALSSDVNAGVTYEGVYFKLIKDIDFEGESVGEYGNFVSMEGFKGIFDGNGKRLKNIKNKNRYEGNNHYAGIFHFIKGAVVKNVIIDESCFFDDGAFIVSAINSTVEGCVNYSNVKGSGIVGYCEDGLITECVNYGEIIPLSVGSGTFGSDGFASGGGIVGRVFYSSISKCKNYGKLVNSNYAVSESGGIAGKCWSTLIQECENHGDIESSREAGGIVGNIQSYPRIDPETANAGKVIGSAVKQCNNYGKVKGSEFVGGIVGYNEGLPYKKSDDTYENVTSEVSDCNNYGEISGEEKNIGGIVGYNNIGDIVGCMNEGMVTSNSSYNVGGIVGYSSGCSAISYEPIENLWAIIKDCKNKAAVSAALKGEDISNEGYVGGIVGNVLYPHSIIDCSNSGDVSGYRNVGGIAGDHDTDMTGCSNSGNITAKSLENNVYAGAIVGYGLPTYNNSNWENNYYDSQVVVTVDDVEYSGAMSRGASKKYDVPEKNGAMMKSFTIEAKSQGDEYWTTFQKNYGNYQADENTTVYTAQRVLREQNDGPQVYRLLLTEVPNRIIKGGEDGYFGVILRSTQSQITLTLTAEESSEADYSDNVLGGCDHPIESDNDDFVLTTGEKFGFIKCVDPELPANSAYTSSFSSNWPDLVELELNGKVLYHIEPGDLNGDDITNLSDLRLMLNAIMTGSYDSINEKAADMNNDTKVNAADVVLMVKKVNKLVQKEETGYYLIGDHNGWSTTDKTYAFSYSRRKNYWEITVSSEGMGCFKIVPESAYADTGTFWSNLLCTETDRSTSLKGTIVKGDFGAWLLNADGATSYTIRIVPSGVSYEIIAH